MEIGYLLTYYINFGKIYISIISKERKNAMKKTKFLLLLLCFCMILPVLAACGGGDDGDTGHDGFVYDYDDSCREKAIDSVPEGYQLYGRTVGLFYAQHIEASVIGMDQFLEDYDLVYSKVFERNKMVEMRLNTHIKMIPSATTYWGDVTTVLRQKIIAGDDETEIVMSTNNTIVQNKLFNYFYDISGTGEYDASEFIDLSENWWYEDAIMETSVDGYSLRLLYGDINMSTYGNAGAIYYNKRLYDSGLSEGKGRDYLYEVVLDGKWTFDMLYKLTKDSHRELGPAGPDGDQFGYLFTRHGEALHYIPVGMGITYYTRDAMNMPVINLLDNVNMTKSYKVAEMMYNFMWENPGFDDRMYQKLNGEEANFPYSFANADYVFQLGTIGNALGDAMREMEDDYGLIPFPKYDYDQEEYVSFMANGTVLVGMPVIVSEDDMATTLSAVIECMCSEAYRSVSITYFDTALKGAYSRDPESAQMIDIIMGQHPTIKSKLTKNLVYEYSWSLAGVGRIYQSLCSTKDKNFKSKYDSIIGAENAAMRILFQKYQSGEID